MFVALGRAGSATSEDRPPLDLYSVRYGRLVDDDTTFPEQGIQEGDVLVLLVDDIEGHLLEFLDASRGGLRESLPTDLPIKGWHPYEEVLMAVERREHSGGIHIGQVVGDIGILAERIEGSVVQVNKAAVDDELKELMRQLGEQATSLLESTALTDDEKAAVSVKVEDVATEAAKSPAERAKARWRDALDSLLSYAKKVGDAGTSLATLVAQIGQALG
ncbi:hypothetical protein [Georgenia satyanarayanai]|uniref:hypothetical protein n=1 Tax=Georgenia satyanarayanai TaxID=860221 RepID=UPI001263ED1C|nr:hypothetical protein [Georgenia satyanarayanai]